jgi:hypothetical protein
VDVVLLAVTDGKGLPRTPDTAALFKNGAPLEGGAVGRAVLAGDMRRLGFGIDWGTGRGGRFFELRGVPQRVIRAMSGRAREVEEEIAAREGREGRSLSGRERALVALETRTSKDRGLPAWKVQQYWDALAQELGFGSAQVEELRGLAEPARELEQLRAEAREVILRRVAERGPTVSIGAARAIAFEVAPMGLTLEQANDLLRDMQRSGELIALEGERVTTGDIRGLEQRVIDIASTAAQRPARPVSRSAYERGVQVAERSLGSGVALDRGQRDAIKAFTDGRGWALLSGHAGTGKGPVLKAVAAAHRADGWRVVACAVDGTTAQQLGQLIGAQALTIDRVAERLKRGMLRVDDRTLFVVEEASKVGARHWWRLAKAVERSGARLLAVGHTGQLGAIVLPGLFQFMLDTKAILKRELTEIHRHRDPRDPTRPHPWLADCQVALDGGDSAKAIGLLREHDAISMHDTREQAVRALVDGWDRRRRAYGDPRDAILVVQGSNEDVDHVNKLAQQRRWRAGELAGEPVAAVDRDYGIYVNDVVMLRETSYASDPHGTEPRIENGATGIVVAVDADRERVKVRFDEPDGGRRDVVIDLGKLGREHRRMLTRPPSERSPVATLRLAYGFHPFPLQGATVKDVAVLAAREAWAEYKEAAYVAITRAARVLHVHCDRESLAVAGTDRDPYKALAKAWKRSRNKLSSIAYEQTDTQIALDRLAAAPEISFSLDVEAAAAGQDDALDRAHAERLRRVLGRHGDALGERRAAEIVRSAARLAPEMARLDDDALTSEQARTEHALDALHRGDARIALSVERDHRIAQERVRETLERARELQLRARDAGPLRRHERRDLRQAAKTQRRLAEREQDKLAALAETDRQLRKQQRHVDDWTAEHRHQAARWVAAGGELAARHERATERTDPPDGRRDQGRRPAEPELVPTGVEPSSLVHAGPGGL